jgi:hypothetical protein
MLSKEETSRKNQILPKFCITLGVTLYLIKFRYDKFIYVFDFLHVPRFYRGLAKIYFLTCCLMCTTFLILLAVLILFC